MTRGSDDQLRALPSPVRARPPGRDLPTVTPFMLVLTLLALVGLLHGCASQQAGNYDLGIEAMQRGRVDEALIWLERAVVYDPGNAAAHRDYGSALYLSGNPTAAVRELEQARDLGLIDGTTVFYLGLAYEGIDRRYAAVEAYAEYLKIGELDELRKPVQARLRKLTREIVAEEVQLALAADADPGASVPAPDPDTIAVLPFRAVTDDEELIALRTGLAALVAEDLERIEQLKIVDRLRLAAVRESLSLEHGAMIDTLGTVRTGRLLAAGRVVTASMTTVGDERLEVEGAVGEVSSGALRWTEPVDEELDRFYEAQKRLVFAILAAMGIEPSAEIRLAIESSVPTRSLLALLAYSRGLELEDRGMRSAARNAFLQAMNFDPAFRQALEGLSRLGLDDEIDDDSILTPREMAERDMEMRANQGTMGAGAVAGTAAAGAATADAPETAQDSQPPPDSRPFDPGSALDELMGGGLSNSDSRLTRSSGAAQTGQAPSGSTDTRAPSTETAAASGEGPGGFGTATVNLEVEIPGQP